MMAGAFVHLLDEIQGELKADLDPRFDPPYTTLEATMIEGGTAVNILARDALITWGIRALPGRNAGAIIERAIRRADAEILPGWRAQAPEAYFETRVESRYPALVLNEDSAAVKLARALTGANRVDAVAYGTEAGHFSEAGIPAVICGPGSIDQAHKADEFVALSELAACESFLRKVIARACQ
jgi:acetylornithine deacetylase